MLLILWSVSTLEQSLRYGFCGVGEQGVATCGRGGRYTSNDIYVHHAHPHIVASDPPIDAAGDDFVLQDGESRDAIAGFVKDLDRLGGLGLRVPEADGCVVGACFVDTDQSPSFDVYGQPRVYLLSSMSSLGNRRTSDNHTSLRPTKFNRIDPRSMTAPPLQRTRSSHIPEENLLTINPTTILLLLVHHAPDDRPPRRQSVHYRP